MQPQVVFITLPFANHFLLEISALKGPLHYAYFLSLQGLEGQPWVHRFGYYHRPMGYVDLF